jgi:hypothetical protein
LPESAAGAHVYLPHGGAISMMVRLSGGQMVEAATIGRTASVLDAADFRAAAHRSVTFRAMVARHEQACSQWLSNPPHATHRTRSKYACHAGCCVHAIHAAAKRCR